MQTKEETFRQRILDTANKALDIVDHYIVGGEDDDARVPMAFKILGQGVKILHMNQVRGLGERTQALRLLRFLPDDKSRQEYIKLTNPQVAPLMLDRPKKK